MVNTNEFGTPHGLNLAEALSANEFHFETCTRLVGPRGGISENIIRHRRNGATQTWKTRPTEYRIPVVHGLKHYGNIWHSTRDIHTAENCPIRGACCSCESLTIRPDAPYRDARCFCSCHTV